MAYSQRLENHAKVLGRDVRVAIVGAGQMGRGFGGQISRMPGLALALVVDIDADRIRALFNDIGIRDVVISTDPKILIDAMEAGKAAGTTTTEFIAELPFDVVVEATGVPDIGARVTYACLLAKKDVAVLNVEMDVTIGPLLHKTAQLGGAVYTVCHGDEPVEAKVLVDFARDLQFEIVAAGKGKNNPFEPLSTPDTVKDRALAKQMNPKMLCSFTDGSKTMIEMAALANTTGLELSKRGMYGPQATVKTLQNVFSLQADGGVLDRPGVVDYCMGDVAPGVFVIVRTDAAYINHEMSYLGMGSGPYFALYRPFHLASVEAPLSVARAVLDRESSLYAPHLQAEVCTMAKKDMNPGDVIDGIGGYTVRGYSDIAKDAKRDNLVPIGLIQGAIVQKAIKVGDLITYDHVQLNEKSLIVQLRRMQDNLGLTYAAG
ncbi:MAG: SAF domain-containing protein [Actinobacteria bacterium]|nr:SAF domain-containing protein [Actinomycetota bacterium]